MTAQPPPGTNELVDECCRLALAGEYTWDRPLEGLGINHGLRIVGMVFAKLAIIRMGEKNDL